MTRRSRLDSELVRRGLARSREHAAQLVRAGRVTVRGLPAAKVASGVDRQTAMTVSDEWDGPSWVSRGASKLLAALDRFGAQGLTVAGRRCLDAGASTGGFTQVLLERGAREVVAADVGYGVLAWRLRTDPRVAVHERSNARSLTAGGLGGTVSLTVADLSFISLRLVLPALRACTEPGGDLVVLVKPQFEVGRERVGAGGVVREPALREAAVHDVAADAARLELSLHDALASPLPGPAGNVEYFLWLRRAAGTAPAPSARAEALLRAAVREGPW